MTRSSKRSTVADWDVAVRASVLLIIASRNAEGNTAATKPQTSDEADEEDDPAKTSSRLMNNSHAGLSALVASNLNGVIWEVWIVRSWSSYSGVLDVDHWLRLSSLHHWLTWLDLLRVLLLRVWLCLCIWSCHHGLSLCVWLRHLSFHDWLSLHHRLCLHDWGLIDKGFLFVRHY